MKQNLMIASALGICGLLLGWGARTVLPREFGTSHTGSASSFSLLDQRGKTPAVGISESERDKQAITDPAPDLETLYGSSGPESRRLLVTFLAGADLDDILKLIEGLASRTSSKLGDWANLICLRGAELDAPAFVAWLEHFEGGEGHRYRWLAFCNWAKLDRPAAIRALAGSEGDPFRHTILAYLQDSELDTTIALIREHWHDAEPLLSQLEGRRIASLTAADPTAALAKASNQPGAIGRVRATRGVVSEWAKTDPEAAWEWLQQREYRSDRAQLTSTILEAMAGKDPAAAIAKADTLPGSEAMLRLKGNIVAKWAEQEVDAALRWALDEPNPRSRARLLARLGPELAKSNPTRFLETLHEQGIGFQYLRDQSVRSAMRAPIKEAAKRIAEDDPGQALTYLQLVQAGDDFGIATRWAASDPSAAVAWAATFPENLGRSSVMSPMLKAWAVKDPTAAAAFLDSTDLGPEKESLARAVTAGWVPNDPDAALTWASQVGASAFTAAVGQGAASAPGTTAAFVENLDDSDLVAKAAEALTRPWSYTDPRATLDWLASMTHRGVNVSAPTYSAAVSWTNRAPEEVSEWIGASPHGTTRDAALTGMLEVLTGGSDRLRDFNAAALWVDEINDAALKQKWVSLVRHRLARELNLTTAEQ